MKGVDKESSGEGSNAGKGMVIRQVEMAVRCVGRALRRALRAGEETQGNRWG